MGYVDAGTISSHLFNSQSQLRFTMGCVGDSYGRLVVVWLVRCEVGCGVAVHVHRYLESSLSPSTT